MLILGFILPTAFLSMWISNTATTAMMVPILEAVIAELESAAAEEPDFGDTVTPTEDTMGWNTFLRGINIPTQIFGCLHRPYVHPLGGGCDAKVRLFRLRHPFWRPLLLSWNRQRQESQTLATPSPPLKTQWVEILFKGELFPYAPSFSPLEVSKILNTIQTEKRFFMTIWIW